MSDIVEKLREGETEGVDGWWFVMAEGANEIERLRSRIESAEEAYVRLDGSMNRLKSAFRVNMLRTFSNMSHEEIDAEIEAAIRESGDD